MPNKPKRVASGTILSPEDLGNLTNVEVKTVWTPNPKQLRVLQRKEFEVFCAASKYSGKTEMSRIWMVRGNMDQPNYDESGQPILPNISYTYHPNFLGAVIRLNEKDLSEWVDRARPYYEDVLGGVFTKNPAEFRWPSGARIFLGHAQDTNAWTKYQGQNIVRFLIEESGQIPDIETFDMIRSCCRSLYPEMQAQILLTANPGGRGQAWQFDRYIEPKDRQGHPVMHPTENRPIIQEDGGFITIPEPTKNPFTGETIIMTRVWAPLYFVDNPHAMSDTSYIGVLATMQDEKMKRAYLFGDWKAFQGSYFDIFTKERHTYDPNSKIVSDWWKPTASLDWGFQHESAAYWHKQDPDTRQNIVYKEFCTNHTDPYELGAELARRSLPELRVHGSLTFHVSHDLFHDRIGDITWAEMIAKGAQKELGQGTCYVPDVIITRVKEQYRIEGKEWDEEEAEYILNKPISGIVFRRAPKARAVGFMYLRSLMRVTPAISVRKEGVNWEVATKILQEGTSEDYSNYIRSFNAVQEVLPQMLISQACPRLIEAIPKAIHSPDHPEDVDDKHFTGMDQIDSLRYLMTGIRDESPSRMPKNLQANQEMDRVMRQHPEYTTRDLIWVAKGVQERIDEEDSPGEGFCLGRGSSRFRR